ncbi:thymidine phosphorylase [Geminicoccaceae bacterium 1502E]|nr:thymidine phosphorylase [Geminicoccaceae bacterium 1502E]
MPLPQEIIRRKRDGLRLEPEEIGFFVRGIADGSIGDAQAAAFAMAVVLRGMEAAEAAALALSMRDSGRTLAWDLPGPVLDKHSTGGVGDKVSLVLAPLMAACGAFVPMISGRGLGHTGGTLDKLDAIPGYRSEPDPGTFREVVAEAGCAIVGASAELAPADRRLYAIRDVTATVESIPLIAASILSKKLAAGIGGLVMDVKTGSGAFLPEPRRARALARAIVEIARGAGLACRALLTSMDQCLGRTAGNALEVGEAVALLRGEPGDARLREVVLALASELLALGGLAADRAPARRMAERALASGAAAERFARMVAGLGGPADLLDRPERHLRRAGHLVPVLPEADGFVASVDVRALGLAVVLLGGGRSRPGEAIDHAVGLDLVAGVGEAVGAQRPLAVIHASRESGTEEAVALVRGAFRLAEQAPAPDPVVGARIGASPGA